MIELTEQRYKELLDKEKMLGQLASDIQQVVYDCVPQHHLFAGHDNVDLIRKQLTLTQPLQVAIAELPTGCTLIIYRTEIGYRIQVRKDFPLQSYESAFIQDIGQAGEIIMYVIVEQEV